MKNRKKLFKRTFWLTIGFWLIPSILMLPFTAFLMLADRVKTRKTVFDMSINPKMTCDKMLKSLARQRAFYYLRWGGVALLTAFFVIGIPLFIFWIVLAVRNAKKIEVELEKTQNTLTDDEFVLWVKILNKHETTDEVAVKNLYKKLDEIDKAALNKGQPRHEGDGELTIIAFKQKAANTPTKIYKLKNADSFGLIGKPYYTKGSWVLPNVDLVEFIGEIKPKEKIELHIVDDCELIITYKQLKARYKAKQGITETISLNLNMLGWTARLEIYDSKDKKTTGYTY